MVTALNRVLLSCFLDTAHYLRQKSSTFLNFTPYLKTCCDKSKRHRNIHPTLKDLRIEKYIG